MIKTILIDDEAHAIQVLESLIMDSTSSISIVARESNIKDALKAIKEHNPQLVFLDINLGKQTAFDLLELVDTINFKLVFTTAHNEYAIKAFKYNALDYLLKPIDPDELIKTIAKIEKAIEEENKTKNTEDKKTHTFEGKLLLNTADRIYIINLEEIIRCESDGNYTKFFLTENRNILISKTIKEYEDKLENKGFVRIHNSHLININHISSVEKRDGGYVIMKDKSSVPLSHRKKEKLFSVLQL